MGNNSLVRAFIVDDDANAAKLLKKLLENYSVEIVGVASDASPQVQDEITELEPDMLFLDVELPSMSGLDFWSRLNTQVLSDMRVVFYTGYDRYMLDALRRKAFDYLLKPASQQELAQVMTRYYEDKLSSMREVIQQDVPSPRSIMVVTATNEHMVLRFDDVAFFRFDNEKRIWEVVTSAGKSYQLRHRTTSETILTFSNLFVQIHKGYIVNVHQIDKVIENQCLLRPPLNHIKELRISKNFRHDFMTTFYNL